MCIRDSICPVSHHLAAAKAMDVIVGAGTGDGLTPTGEKMRRLMHYGQMFQSHTLHFFHLASPDLLFGVDADPAIRNVIGVVLEHKDLAVQAVLMRKFGQEIIRATAGKKIHGTGAIPGGINKNLSPEERDEFLKGPDPLNADKMVEWAQAAVDLFKDYHSKHSDMLDNFAVFPSNHLSLVRKDGAMDLYHGVLRAVDPEGKKILNDVDYQDYYNHIGEEVKNWSYMKFPYLKKIGWNGFVDGKDSGVYRVAPLARLNVADCMATPRAQKEFEKMFKILGGKPAHNTLAFHWARLIEVMFAAEHMVKMLEDKTITSTDIRRLPTDKPKEGIGIVEAPRGTLIHHYKTDEEGMVTGVNLIVATVGNSAAMSMSIARAAQNLIKNGEFNDGILNMIEMAFRPYDPCLACATHSLPGKMPLMVNVYDKDRNKIKTITRD